MEPAVAQEDRIRRKNSPGKDLASRQKCKDDTIRIRPSRVSGGDDPIIIRKISAKQIADVECTLYPESSGVSLAYRWDRWDEESLSGKLH